MKGVPDSFLKRNGTVTRINRINGRKAGNILDMAKLSHPRKIFSPPGMKRHSLFRLAIKKEPEAQVGPMGVYGKEAARVGPLTPRGDGGKLSGGEQTPGAPGSQGLIEQSGGTNMRTRDVVHLRNVATMTSLQSENLSMCQEHLS